MNKIGDILNKAGDTFYTISHDKGFKNLEVLKILASTVSMDKLPEESVYQFLKKSLNKKGYRYACRIIEAHITKDKNIIIETYLNRK